MSVISRDFCAFLISSKCNASACVRNSCLSLLSVRSSILLLFAMVNPQKGTAQALKRGVQFKAALSDVKNNVSPKPAKWKAPSIPLKTQVGVGGLTIKTLMDSEKITYEEAVQVYLAFQESQRSPAGAGLKNQVTPKARPSKAKEASETPPKRGRSPDGAKPPKSKRGKTAEAEPSPDRAKPPKSKQGKTAEADAAEPSPDTAEPTRKSKRGKTTEAEVAEPSPDAAEPSSSSKPGKAAAKLKRGRASSDLGKHETEAPARRVVTKSSPALQATTAEPVQPSSDDWDWGGDDADTVWYEYDLWRQGLPQLSELDSDLKKHRDALPHDVENVPYAEPTENQALLENPAPPSPNSPWIPNNAAASSPATLQKDLEETLKEMLVSEYNRLFKHHTIKIMIANPVQEFDDETQGSLLCFGLQ